MPNVLLINRRGGDRYSEILSGGGYTVLRSKDALKAIKKINGADMLLLCPGDASYSKDLAKAVRDLPKIIITDSSPSKGLDSWLREPFAFPIYDPSERGLLLFAARILKEHEEHKQGMKTIGDLKTVKGELGFLEEMQKVLGSSNDIEEILVMIMRRTKELTRAEAWSIIFLEEATGELYFQKTNGRIKKELKKLRLKVGEGVAGWVAEHGMPVVIPDACKDKRFLSKFDRICRFKTKSIMCAPVKIKDKTIGVIEVVNKANGGSFTDADLALLVKLIEQASMAIDRILLYQKLEELVITDDLTNLFNTRYLNRSIETEIQRSRRHSTSVSLIFMDLDYFKNINDTHGHLVGSRVLVEIARILINELRTIDIVARYGGDEFVIVLPQTTLTNAMNIAERLRRSVEKSTFLVPQGLNLKLTASFGVASYPESAHSKEELLKIADESMYRVKNRSRNDVYAII